ncbi:MAG: hypothetical protein PCFJNLEI_02250 [Verrucomicrobiae bacterium]|nr:hypothetical protein [Verrucomicrobiae bacterium]
MEQIGKQVRLPFRRAFQIALSGIRIRFGRSVVTVSGVVLGIAFLMSNLTGQLIKKSIAEERDQRNTVNLMLSLIKAEIGEVAGRQIAVSTFGQLSPVEQLLLTQLKATAIVRDGPEAGLRIVLGDQPQVPVTLASLTAGMSQSVVIDSLATRAYAAGDTAAPVRRELFFGKESEDQLAKEAQLAQTEKFRNWWIVTISLLVTVFGVANALLMSVTERFREIGTMKCLGALSSFIRRLFLIESSLIGLAGSIVGVIVGALLPLLAYGFAYRFALVFGTLSYGWLLVYAVAAAVTGTLLAVLAAIYPAWFASRMVPASALRSTV